MALATVYKDSFKPATPWMVQIAPSTIHGIKGGKQGPWSSKIRAQAWADKFNEMYPVALDDFAPGDEVKFYVGDDLSVTYGVVERVFKKTCTVIVNDPEGVNIYQIEKSKLNYN